MDRRESLKTLFLASFGGSLIASNGCTAGLPTANAGNRLTWTPLPTEYSYGRTETEQAHDAELLSQTFFSNHELVTIAVLCDIILPNDHPNGGALDAGVPDFVEFMAKERENYKVPLRGGIMWLDKHAIDRYGADFVGITEQERRAICDSIAWPDVEDAELQPGIRFFSLLRDLTMTGYYTTALGFRDLGYQGNTPNVWDGVPEQVLRRHGKQYDPEWLAKCVDQSRRDITAEWDDDMNLIT